MNRVARRPLDLDRGIPRASGDEPKAKSVWEPLLLYSPRERG